MKRITSYIFTLLISPVLLCAQQGKDNSISITGASSVINNYYTLSANLAAGSTTLIVNDVTGIASGDLLFIIQMQGATISTANDDTWGSVSNYNNCGFYEFLEVLSTNAGTNTITFSCPLIHSYTNSGKVQVVKVPRYVNLTIQAGASISALPWDGSIGGVVVAEISGNTIINGTIDVTGLGFRPGTIDQNTAYGINSYASINSSDGAEKGESIAGFGADYLAYGGTYGRGAPANGGGGGNAHNAGGGGGSNAGLGIYTGNGNPDISTASWANAWNTEAAGFSGSTSSGGGRGGYTFGTIDLDALSVGPGAIWGGDNRQNVGGRGGHPLDYSSGRIFLGGGAGAGDQNNNAGSDGGSGGGLVFIKSCGTVSGTGAIIANGSPGKPQPVGSAGNDAPGGGGGGGTVIIDSDGSIAGITINANGGKGGSQIINYSECEGPGGGGGGGYIAITNGNPTRSAIGGANGTSTSPLITEFIPNGATKGGAGIANAIYSKQLFTINAQPVSICYGETATLNASLQGNVPLNATISWYTSLDKNSKFSSANSITTTALYKDTTIFVGACPYACSSALQPVKITVKPLPSANAGSDKIVCSGVAATIGAAAINGYTYSWNPAAGSSSQASITLTNATANPVKHEYILTVTSSGCVKKDTVEITVNPNPIANAGNNVNVCPDEEATIGAANVATYTYSWSPALGLNSTNISNPIFKKANAGSTSFSTKYTLTVSALGCTATDTVLATVKPLPVANAGNDISVCPNENGQLGVASVTGYTYNWLPATSINSSTISNPVFKEDNITSANITFKYTLTVTSQGCTKSDSMQATVKPLPIADAGPDTSVCSDNAITLTNNTKPNLTYTWSPTQNLSFTSTKSPQFKALNTTSSPTTYSYKLTVTELGCSASDNVVVTLKPLPTVFAGNDLELCEKVNQTLGRKEANMIYSWYPSNNLSDSKIANPLLTVENKGASVQNHQYILTGNLQGCISFDTVEVKLYPAISTTVNSSEPVCKNENITLEASGGKNYLWSTGETSSSISISAQSSGYYYVSVENICKASDSIYVKVKNDESYGGIYIPNAFTPNNDGENDFFQIKGVFVDDLKVSIFDRWGAEIYHWDGINGFWDGRLNGNVVQTDVYVYVVKFKPDCGDNETIVGHISALR
ncbi:MAG: gliding motility-associated C-terminal domain-containing protein [Bacteroidetes bacterium]|nr:gliding motility-associated C-terminal domain-containing protein [Bacteroidota bacterium]